MVQFYFGDNVDKWVNFKLALTLGQALDLKVVAEGIESEPQARLLKNLNCDILQGFYFHTPQPRHAAEKLFAAQRKRR